jgi:alpha-1,2-mannosyltransferase
MINKVIERRPAYNNQGAISSSVSISLVKQLYYRLFKVAYSFVGTYASVVIVNSSWTENHIRSLWGFHCDNDVDGRKLYKIFPPCNSEHYQTIPIDVSRRERVILSLGQFRPEKDHLLQLHALHELRKLDSNRYRLLLQLPWFTVLIAANPLLIRYSDVTLEMIGSVRNRDDERIVDGIIVEANKLGLSDSIRLKINAPYAELVAGLSSASIAIHTMWNEHFGISIVEMMAAGLLVVAHDSGGPKMDIVAGKDDQPVGYLASTAPQYALMLKTALDLNHEESERIRLAARVVSNRFSDNVFKTAMLKVLTSIN